MKWMKMIIPLIMNFYLKKKQQMTGNGYGNGYDCPKKDSFY